MSNPIVSDPRYSFLQSVTSGDVNAVHALVSGTTIRIVATQQAVHSFAGQVLLYQLATLTARLFDRVEIQGDDSAICHSAFALLSGSFLPALRNVLPTLRSQHAIAADNFKTVTVLVGQEAISADIYLGATAWGARYSTVEPQGVDAFQNSIGALASGTLGASEIFKLVFQGQIQGAASSAAYTLSLLDYGPIGIPEPHLPDLVNMDATLFGCGSIGCGLLLGLVLTPQLHGRIAVVDNGCFDTKNPVKYQLLDQATAQQKVLKASWAQKQLCKYAGSRLSATAFVGTAENYVASLPIDYTIPLAVSAVDSYESRFQIQDTLPRRIINAGIDGTSVEVSAHSFGDGPCLACLQLQADLESWNAAPIASAVGLPPARAHHLILSNEGMNQDDLNLIKARGIMSPEQVDSYLNQPLGSLWQRAAYSQASVQVNGAATTQITTAFVSAFAGVLLLAELVKQLVIDLSGYQVSNAYQQNLLGVPADGYFRHSRDSHGWCLCHSSFRQAVYREKYLL